MGVVKLSDYRPPLEVVEHRVAQLEDGYTRIANELLDAAMASGFSETELCVLLAVWRKTYGYSKKMDWVSNEQLEKMVAKHHTHCSTAKNLLISKKVLLQEGRKVGVNTNIADWKTKINGFCKTLAKPAKKTLAEPAIEPKQKLLTTKDNIQKTKENTPNPLTEVVAKDAKPKRRTPITIDYSACMNAYNELVGERLPHAVELNDDRKKKLKTLVTSLATPNEDGFRAYVKAFLTQARPFHFGDNDRDWVANFDYLLRRKVLTAIREGTL